MDKISIVGIGASVLTAASLVPQLFKLIREKKAEHFDGHVVSIIVRPFGARSGVIRLCNQRLVAR
jgi:uncharacterized protein with PQ loop repeat